MRSAHAREAVRGAWERAIHGHSHLGGDGFPFVCWLKFSIKFSKLYIDNLIGGTFTEFIG